MNLAIRITRYMAEMLAALVVNAIRNSSNKPEEETHIVKYQLQYKHRYSTIINVITRVLSESSTTLKYTQRVKIQLSTRPLE